MLIVVSRLVQMEIEMGYSVFKFSTLLRSDITLEKYHV